MSLRSTFIAKSPARVSLWCETFSLYMKKDTYNHVLKYTGLLGGVQVFYILMSIVRNKFTAMFIGAWGIGLVETYNRAVDLIANMTNFGIGFSAVRRLSELHEQRKP